MHQLNPRLEDGLLRVRGRLAHAPVPYEKKHPIILPYKHHVTDLIIKQYHESLGHMGQECVLSSLRETFWVVKGRSAVRRVLRRCIDCQRRNTRPGEQFMVNLPEERLTPDKPPFTFVGVDYFGLIILEVVRVLFSLLRTTCGLMNEFTVTLLNNAHYCTANDQ